VYALQTVVSSFVFVFAIVLSVLVRYVDSDYPFGTFKHFLIRAICIFDVLISFSVYIYIFQIRDYQKKSG
jgi:hypothetical protein